MSSHVFPATQGLACLPRLSLAQGCPSPLHPGRHGCPAQGCPSLHPGQHGCPHSGLSFSTPRMAWLSSLRAAILSCTQDGMAVLAQGCFPPLPPWWHGCPRSGLTSSPTPGPTWLSSFTSASHSLFFNSCSRSLCARPLDMLWEGRELPATLGDAGRPLLSHLD